MEVKAPGKIEKFTLRYMIILGVLGIANFVYWFFTPSLIDNKFLFTLLALTLIYSLLRVLYEWYHYWSISVPKQPKVEKEYTVDILTTYFPGEPYEMIEHTLKAIQKITYPHTTYLCDEGNDAHLKAFCQEHGVVHVTRTNRIDAKAGNINNALKQAKGEICVILDPDHVPDPDFLDQVIPYFEDEKIGYVQIVQAYKNLHESYVAKGAAQQTFQFYGPMMMTMNTYGTVNAIGANCTFRREALDSIGGHAAGLSEDMHTAMQLHAMGWKSVYVPKVLARGLVPSSLTAYYKQQLKWSRGTLELLVSVYPKLFKKFTWRQKLHYGFIPMHYLIGVFYLINFLIPVISLLTGTTPWKGNVGYFGFLIIPVITSILVIRTYVQRWVMEERERGVHAVGGLLQISAWWVFCLGLVYTILRKKIPYLPTPKTGEDKTSWKLIAPNIAVAFLSILAIFIGLQRDFTPFSIFMAGFAFLNVCFMAFSVYLASHRYEDVSKMQDTFKKKLYDANMKAKTRFWRFRHAVYKGIRTTAVPILLGGFIISLGLIYYVDYLKWDGVKSFSTAKQIHGKYLGIYYPVQNNGVSDMGAVQKLENNITLKFDIVSHYIPWEEKSSLNSLNDILKAKKAEHIPMITWEPWTGGFDFSTENDDLRQERKVMKHISEGHFDTYILAFAAKIKAYQEPVYLRFGHEFNNPEYPWSATGGNTAEEYVAAWKHILTIFNRIGAKNVRWIWNPWSTENMMSYYPGDDFVDYVGLTGLHYGALIRSQEDISFSEMYLPFAQILKENIPDKPVMLAEFGALKTDPKQNQWIQDALKAVYEDFPEINSIVFFHSGIDRNLPYELKHEGVLDWTLQNPDSLRIGLWNLEDPVNKPNAYADTVKLDYTAHNFKNYHATLRINGVNYKKGQNWYKNYEVLDRRTLISDFEKMKNLGINHIRYWGSIVYDHNVFSISKENNINISYAFWIPDGIDYVTDIKQSTRIQEDILDRIKDLKDHEEIKSWHLGNDILSYQFRYNKAEDLYEQQLHYVKWLNALIEKVKIIDPERPVIIDLNVNRNVVYHSKLLLTYVKHADVIGLSLKSVKYLDSFTDFAQQEGISYILNDVDPNQLEAMGSSITGSTGIFFRAWQDQHQSNVLSYDGLLDHKERYKWEYALVGKFLDSAYNAPDIREARILRPSTPLSRNAEYFYQAILYDKGKNEWTYPDRVRTEDFEWNLVKCDESGIMLAYRFIGNGTRIRLKIPDHYENYRLVLRYRENGFVRTVVSKLNTPLIHTN